MQITTTTIYKTLKTLSGTVSGQNSNHPRESNIIIIIIIRRRIRRRRRRRRRRIRRRRSKYVPVKSLRHTG